MNLSGSDCRRHHLHDGWSVRWIRLCARRLLQPTQCGLTFTFTSSLYSRTAPPCGMLMPCSPVLPETSPSNLLPLPSPSFSRSSSPRRLMHVWVTLDVVHMFSCRHLSFSPRHAIGFCVITPSFNPGSSFVVSTEYLQHFPRVTPAHPPMWTALQTPRAAVPPYIRTSEAGSIMRLEHDELTRTKFQSAGPNPRLRRFNRHCAVCSR